MSKIIPIGGNNVDSRYFGGFKLLEIMQKKLSAKKDLFSQPDVDQNEIIEITSIADHPTKHVSRKALTDITPTIH